MNFKHSPETTPKYTPAEERQILEQARLDLHAFTQFYEAYSRRIYSYCLRRVSQPEEAEDLTSLVFTRAMTGLSSYRGGSAAAWLFQIAHNAVANHMRDRPARLASIDSLNLPEPGDIPLEILLKHEQQKRLLGLVERLNEDQRELLALSVAGELTAKEAGQILGKSEGAVRMALRRLLQQLRAGYEQAEGAE